MKQVIFILTLLCFCLDLDFACRRSPPSPPSTPPCTRRDCSYTSWGSWSACTASCGSNGLKVRTRSIKTHGTCGGRSCDSSKLKQRTSCPHTCCPLNCRYTWSTWSSCGVSCGYGTRLRTIKIIASQSFGGRSCPTRRMEVQKCGDGRCFVLSMSSCDTGKLILISDFK